MRILVFGLILWVSEHNEALTDGQRSPARRHVVTQDGLSTIEQTSSRPRAVHEGLLRPPRQYVIPPIGSRRTTQALVECAAVRQQNPLPSFLYVRSSVRIKGKDGQNVTLILRRRLVWARFRLSLN